MNLKWQAHVAQVLHIKMKEWPPSMNVQHLAFLQDSDKAMRVVILDQLISDCKSKEIEHTSKTLHSRFVEFQPGQWITNEAYKEHLEGHHVYVRQPQPPEGFFIEYSITAEVFACWLKAHGLTPSEMMRAWFDAYRVSQEAAPTVNAAPVSAGSSANEKPNNLDKVEWSPELLKKTRDAFEGDGKGRPMQRLVEASGIKERDIRRRIAGIKEPEINPNSPFQFPPRQNAGHRRA